MVNNVLCWYLCLHSLWSLWPVSLYPVAVNNWRSYSLCISDRLLISGRCREHASVPQKPNEARTNPYLMPSTKLQTWIYHPGLLVLHTFAPACPHGCLPENQNSGDCFGRLQKTNGLPNPSGENSGFLLINYINIKLMGRQWCISCSSPCWLIGERCRNSGPKGHVGVLVPSSIPALLLGCCSINGIKPNGWTKERDQACFTDVFLLFTTLSY